MRQQLPRRRELRLVSGFVLLGYMASHMVNHALGLVSLAAAERALGLAVAVWHSLPGTLVLYGAAATHVGLAFLLLYERHSLRLSAIEVVRVVAGFSIPLLLVSHFASTRVAFELYAAAPQYERIVGAIWSSHGEARQLALLAPGWLHGCLGIHLAYGRRPWYGRCRLVLLLVALLLPLMAGAGFLAMTAEIAERGVEPQSGIAREFLAGLRNGFYVLYAALLLLVLGARQVRQRRAARSGVNAADDVGERWR